VIRLDYTSGALVERHYLDLLDPVGLPIVRMEVPVPNGSTATLVARPQWTAFGELRNTVSAELPPWGFHGQVVATETTANAPNGSLLQTLRSPLSLNTWRVYDPRVGQYLTPEPLATEGATRWSAFGYALEAPYDLWGPDGRFISSCTATPSAAIACGAGIGGAAALGTATTGTGTNSVAASGRGESGVTPATVAGAIEGAICVAASATGARGGTRNPPRVLPTPRRVNRCTEYLSECLDSPVGVLSIAGTGNHWGESQCVNCFNICLATGGWPASDGRGMSCDWNNP